MINFLMNDLMSLEKDNDKFLIWFSAALIVIYFLLYAISQK